MDLSRGSHDIGANELTEKAISSIMKWCLHPKSLLLQECLLLLLKFEDTDRSCDIPTIVIFLENLVVLHLSCECLS